MYGWNLQRKLISRVANYLAGVLLDPMVSDLTGSFRLFKRPCLERLVTMVGSKGYSFQMEVIMEAQRLKYSLGEVPIVFVDRMFGESKLGRNEIFEYLIGLMKLFFKMD